MYTVILSFGNNVFNAFAKWFFSFSLKFMMVKLSFSGFIMDGGVTTVNIPRVSNIFKFSPM